MPTIMRTVAICDKCHQSRPIVAHKLCKPCWQTTPGLSGYSPEVENSTRFHHGVDRATYLDIVGNHPCVICHTTSRRRLIWHGDVQCYSCNRSLVRYLHRQTISYQVKNEHWWQLALEYLSQSAMAA